MLNNKINRRNFISNLATGLVIGSLFAASSLVSAQDTDNPRRERLLERFDRNDNGSLGPRERRQVSEFQDRLDRNNDGRIGNRERRTARRIRANRNQ
ncbi:MAG: hypothetical protein ACI9XC_002052 [Gammaproteobacteria bacterium]|jgi:hypothetical protein